MKVSIVTERGDALIATAARTQAGTSEHKPAQQKGGHDQMSNCKRYTEQELQQLLSDGIAELHKDKARLDWLADVNNTIGNVQLPRDIVERNLHSLRAAIDEAMKL